jgi:putative membrane protein
MEAQMADYYTWIKTVHLISLIIFVGGMLMNGFIFRHVVASSPEGRRVLVAAVTFNRYFVGTALALVWIAGLTLVWILGAHREGWFMTKFVIVFILSGIHGAQTGRLAKMAKSPDLAPSAFMVNSGVITLLLVIATVWLVTVKPF